jgi:hypothetical protein
VKNESRLKLSKHVNINECFMASTQTDQWCNLNHIPFLLRSHSEAAVSIPFNSPICSSIFVKNRSIMVAHKSISDLCLCTLLWNRWTSKELRGGGRGRYEEIKTSPDALVYTL